MSPPAYGSVCLAAWRDVIFGCITSSDNMVRLTLLYFLASKMLQISNCTMCERCLPVADFNEKKSSSVSSDDMAHCSNDLFYCKLLELKDHLWVKWLGHWNYADNKTLLLHRCLLLFVKRNTTLSFSPKHLEHP